MQWEGGLTAPENKYVYNIIILPKKKLLGNRYILYSLNHEEASNVPKFSNQSVENYTYNPRN